MGTRTARMRSAHPLVQEHIRTAYAESHTPHVKGSHRREFRLELT